MSEEETKQYDADLLRVIGMMTPEQAAKIDEPMAMSLCQRLRFQMGSHPQQLTGHFHQVADLPIAPSPILPSVSDRLRRGMLLLEEVLELFAAMGLRLVVNDDCEMRQAGTLGYVYQADESEGEPFILEHIEGSRYDMVETTDGLSDINVIVNGTAVEFGIPLHVMDYEVYSSNLTKVRPDGTKILNGITEGCRAGEPGHQPYRPDGKVLKPESFAPANIPAALVAYMKKEF